MSARATRGSQTQLQPSSDVSGILQSSTTIAALAVAFAAFLPQVSDIKTSFTIGLLGRQYSLVVLILLFCGLLSLAASISCVRDLQRTQAAPRTLLNNPLALLNAALVLSAVGYAMIIWVIS